MTRSTPAGDVQLNIHPDVAVSISSQNKCVPVGVRICQISNYASDGWSRHRGGDKYNLHVFLTSGKTERLSTVLSRKLLTSEDVMQSDHLHLRKKPLKFKAGLSRCEGRGLRAQGMRGIKKKYLWLLDTSSLNLKINKLFFIKS